MRVAPPGLRSLLPLASGIALSLIISICGADLAAWALPRLALTSVSAGMVVTGIVPLSAWADAVGFTNVQFQVSGQSVGPLVTSGACLTSWDTRGFANGSHTVTAVARDSAGTAVWAPPIVVTVQNTIVDATPPVVSLTAPIGNTMLTGAVSVTATATDNLGVTAVWFTIDGISAGSLLTPQQGQAAWTWVTTTTANGPHVLRAVARDAAGNTSTSAGVTVTVRNAGSGLGGDFDADGYPDLLFQHTDGRLFIWSMNDAVAVSMRATNPVSIDPAWRVVAVDDFNGDRRSDILIQHGTTGQVSLWYMNGVAKIGETVVQGAPIAWRVAATADIDGDGDSDIIWRHPATGQLTAWFVQNGQVSGGGALVPGSVDMNWQIAGAYDMNLDGRSDLVWQNTSTGMLYVWYMNGLTMTQGSGMTPVGPQPVWRLKAIADFNRNGQPDLVWQHQSTGQLYLWHLNGTTSLDSRALSPGIVDPAWQIVGGR